MTSRNEMLEEHLEGFTKFIEERGWVLEPFEHPYEALRARNPIVKDIMSIYQASRNIYLTVTQESYTAWEEYKKVINWIPLTQAEIIARIKGKR